MREHDRRPLPRLHQIDRAAVEGVEPAVDVDRRVECAGGVTVGQIAQPPREHPLARITRAGQATDDADRRAGELREPARRLMTWTRLS